MKTLLLTLKFSVQRRNHLLRQSVNDVFRVRGGQIEDDMRGACLNVRANTLNARTQVVVVHPYLNRALDAGGVAANLFAIAIQHFLLVLEEINAATRKV